MGEIKIMAEYEWDDDQENSEPAPSQDGPKGLRNAYERQKQANKELQDQLKALSEKVRTSEVSSALTAMGLPEKVAKLFPKDIDPTDKDAVKGWADEFGDLFGSTPKAPVPVAPPAASEVMASELQKMNDVATTGTPVSPVSDLQSILDNPNAVNEVPFEQYLEILKKNGANV